jgi:hypothetical protein
VSTKKERALEQISREVRNNTRSIERKLVKAGQAPDPAWVFSAAEHWKALNKLATA